MSASLSALWREIGSRQKTVETARVPLGKRLARLDLLSLMLAGCVGFSPLAQAADVTIVSDNGDLTDNYEGFGGGVFGQSFTATKTGVLSSIELVAGNSVSPAGVSGECTVTVYDSANLTGTVLASDNIGVPSNSDANSYTDYSFSSYPLTTQVNITAGNTYSFKITPATCISVWYTYGSTPSDIYSGGQLYYNGGSQPTLDLYFKVVQGDAPSSATASAYMYANGAVSEPVGLATTIDTQGESTRLMDFMLYDDGTDGETLKPTDIVMHVSGTSTDAERSQVTWRLSGYGLTTNTGTYDASTDTVTFSDLGLTMSNGSGTVFYIWGHYNDTSNLTEDHTYILSIDGDTDITVGSGTTFASTSPITNGTGTTIDVTATQLAFTTQPAGSTSGSALTTQPVVTAQDAFGNTDVDFTEAVTLTEASAGSLSGITSLNAISGVSTFTDVVYTATADQQAFTLTADDEDGTGSDLSTVDANSVTSDVVATQLAFTTQPAPTTVASGVATAFSTVPVVQALDANNTLDTGYSTDIVLAEVNGAGSATITGTGDGDGTNTTVTLTPSSGVATFSGLVLTYTASGSGSETFNLQASSGALSAATSSQLTATNVPAVTDANISISGASGSGGAFKVGDTVTAVWDNTASGDNNSGITAVTVDFSQFGGGAAVSASNSSETWTATYTITSGAIDSSNRNVSVTATNSTGSTTTADTSNATVDNIAPTVTDANLSISGASGTSGAYKIGDTVTASWDNTASGDNNSDTISSATVDFSAFGGGSAVSASNSAGSWTATYTITAGAIDGTNLNVSLTATDNAGNTKTTPDTTSATADNIAPTLTDGALSISGASGNSGVFITGDTITASWNNTGTGDNNSDNIASLTVDFSAFGGGSAVAASNSSGSWTATYTLTAGSANGDNLNIAATATDNAGNTTTTADTSNASADTSTPSGHSVSFDDSAINASESSTVSFTFASAEATASYSYTISSDGGGTNVTGSGTLVTATDQISSLDVSGLGDGTLTLSVVLTDTAGNAATAVTDTATLDTTAPTGHSVSFNDSSINDSEASSVDFTFAGGEVGASYSYTISSDGGGTNVTGSGTLSTATDQISSLDLSGLGDGTLTLSVVLTDTAGNAATAVTNTATLDTTAPTGHSVSFDDSSINDSEASSVDFTFAGGEVGASYSYTISSDGGGTNVTGSGTLSTATDQISSLDLSGLGDGTLTLSVVLTDTAGNAATAVTDTATLDTTAPSGHSVSFDDSPINASESSTVGFTFTGGEVGASYSYTISSDGGGTNVTGSGTLSTATDQISSLDLSGLGDGTLTLSVVLTDTAGNAATAVTDTATLDTTAPTGHSVSFDDSSINDSEASSVSFTFAGGEVGASYSYSISSSGGGTNVTGSGTLATATDQISSLDLSGLSDGTLTLSVTVTDTAGNAATAVTDTATLDSTGPVLAEVTAVTTPGNDNTPSYTFSTSEVGTLAITGSCGTSSSTTLSAAGNHTITLTASDNSSALADGSYTTCALTVTDSAGNSSSALAMTAFTIDTAAPSVVISSTVSDPANAAFTATFTFSEAVTGFTVADISAVNASLSNFSATSTSVYTATISPLSDGSVTLDVNAAVATDSAGNGNTAASQFSITYDATAPTVVITSAASGTTNAAFTATVTFSEDVTGFTVTDISASNASLSNFAATSSSVYTVTVSPTADGTVTLDVNAGVATDGTGNSNTAASQFSITYDATAPTVAISSSETDPTASSPFAVTITFSEAVSGFAATDISVTNGTASNLASSDNITFTADITPAADGAVTVNIAAGVATDTGGTANTAATAFSLTYDGTAPTVSSSVPADDASSVQYDSLIALTFSETVVVGSGQLSIYDADGDTLVESLAVGSAQVSLAGMVLTVTPSADFTPTHSYYLLADAGVVTDSLGNAWAGISDSSGLNFTVANNAPVGTADSATTDEDNAVAIDVLANDSDSDSALNAASVTVTNAPSHGSTSVNTANGVITYTPATDYNGTDTFTYAVDDIYTGNTGDVTVSVTINSVNDAPVAVSDTVETDEDTDVTVDVADNDTDVDSGDSVDTATLTIVSQPAHGTASVVSGEILYNPDADFNGSDSLTYQIDDQNGATSNVATLIINISGVNDAPVAANDSSTTDEDTDVVIDVLANDSDVDGTLDVSQVTIIADPTHGTVAVDNSTGEITYSPTADYNGSDSFTYVVKDNEDATSNIATVSLTITSVNDAPVANDDTVTLLEDTTHNINALGNDTDVDGTINGVAIVTGPTDGTVTVNADSSISYTPTADFNGSDSFSYRVMDDLGEWSNTATVTLTITAVNDAPLANDDSVATDEDTELLIDVAANDSDIDGSLDLTSVTLITDVTNGSLIDNGDGTLSYTPAENYYGSDSFSYQISDNEAGTSDTASVTITINAVNDAPVISGTPASSVLEGATFSFTPTVTDVDSSSFTFSLSGQPDWMSIDSSTGAVTANPAVGDEGDYSNIVITVDDGATVNNSSSLAAFTLTVIGDFDTDGIPDSEDPDIDNDGMSNDYEEQYGFDPYDDSDALEDADGDTISNADEEADGTDPTDADDYFDETAPVLTAPADLTIDATGLFTEVTTSMLLQGATDTSLAVDNVDGSDCCVASHDMLGTGTGYLAPGKYTVTWRASDNKGNEGTAEQTLRIRPLVSFSSNIVGVEGSTAVIRLELNGQAPDYPFEVPYMIDSSSTASSDDYDLVDGSVVFNEGEMEVSLSVPLVADNITEGDETLVISLNDATTNADDLAGGYAPANPDYYDINSGVAEDTSITVMIIEGNVAPSIDLNLTQSGVSTSLIARDEGMATITATVIDPNSGDSHSYRWSGTDTALVDTDGSSTDSTLVFDPAGLSDGLYHVQLRVMDSALAATTQDLYFSVVATLPELLASNDSDGDGTDDATEGTGDSDHDGIPDYLDNINRMNVLPELADQTDGYLVECDPGVRCRLGRFALLGSGGGTRLYDSEMDSLDELISDPSYQSEGGVFDFEIHELATAGQVVQVVFPQVSAIPANAAYRKYMNGHWSNFVVDDNNKLHSAAGTPGYCPPPGGDSWEEGLTEGYHCVQVTIEDGGPNDADGMANRSIEDPGSVSILDADKQELNGVDNSAQSSGGAMGWLSLIGLLGLAGAARKARRSPRSPGVHLGAQAACLHTERASRSPEKCLHNLALVCGGALATAAMSVTSLQTQASDFSDNRYVFIGIGQAHSSLSKGELQTRLQDSGQDVEITNYDTSRGVLNLGIGYEYMPGFAAEFSYLDMGDADTSLDGTVNPAELKQQLRRYHPVGGDGFMLNQVFLNPIPLAPLTDNLRLAATIGVYYWHGQVESSRSELNASFEGGFAPLLGLGLNFQLSDRYRLDGGLKRLMFDGQQLDIWSLRFGAGF
ncbi:tandem-95 repeat protein [Oceanobacter mangrovi]|uniref:tandem-95 repeat protein n=1 Tax=Oceanobacter mangrovi TaxID=2862510 RepID=UPI001C8D266C|nr:Ig-like domain-containing protein [Oceanobacter mangrovi]